MDKPETRARMDTGDRTTHKSMSNTDTPLKQGDGPMNNNALGECPFAYNTSSLEMICIV